jgi:hypothetical protein
VWLFWVFLIRSTAARLKLKEGSQPLAKTPVDFA